MTIPPLAEVLRCLGALAANRGEDDRSDTDLLGRFVVRRDESAFAALLERHGPLVLAVCRRVTGNLHDAEDAFQATFLVLARKAASIRRQESTGTRVSLRVRRPSRRRRA